MPSAPVCEPAVPSLQKYQISDFHEQFVYNSGSVDHLAKQSLHLTVWDREKGRPDEYIGEYRDQLKSMLQVA